MNFLPGRVTGKTGETVIVTLKTAVSAPLTVSADALGTDDSVTVGIRPESVFVGADTSEPHLNGTVSVVEQLGGQTIVYVDVEGDTQMTVVMEGLADISTGEAVRLGLPQAALHVFNERGVAVNRLP
ncbi:MAG: TOBE domain-containing protein [Rhodospirillales bacterium]|nr:TOBE domain-containing protein [Rhodospirillales bacterium]